MATVNARLAEGLSAGKLPRRMDDLISQHAVSRGASGVRRRRAACH